MLSLEEFEEKYACENNMSLESAKAVIWVDSIYKKYVDEYRTTNYLPNTCEDCGAINNVSTYYCGQLGCGKGSWCEKYEYTLCLDCSSKH